jgi:Na+-transporting methylmalonyl-CoA/oxaloacetate decarboxylase gamma subunit
MLLTFLVSIAGMGLLFITLSRFELAAKMTSAQVSRLRRALDSEAPVAPASRIAPSVPASEASG